MSESRSVQTHHTQSPLPIPRTGTSVQNAGSSRRFSHQAPRGTHLGLAPERRQWPPSNCKFWIYESTSPSSSQDGKSSSSSGDKSAGSETAEERRVRTVSPYGSFFAEEMESDTPVEKRPFRQRDEQEHSSTSDGVFLPTRKVPSRSRWTSTSSQAQMAPVYFPTGYPTYTGAVPTAPDHDATSTAGSMTEMPFTALSLAENSRRSQPPLSWRQGYPDHPNHLRWCSNSQWDPHQVTAAAVPRDRRQTNARDGSRRVR
jgi:hypothetical protein